MAAARSLVFVTCLAVGLAVTVATPALAKDCKTNFETGKTTMAHQLRADAEGEAWFNWVQAVWKKYDAHWSNLANSVDQKMNCRQSRGGWTCTFAARPCRSHS